MVVQKQIDVLKAEQKKSNQFVWNQFNPNFISDYKGYQLKMTAEQLDRLFAFRIKGKFVNSAEEFQNVTHVSDEWMQEYASLFKFSDWIKRRQAMEMGKLETVNLNTKDFNKATMEDFKALKGIGDFYAHRIIEEREKIGGFIDIDQVSFVSGLPAEVVVSLKKYFVIKSKINIRKININTASREELQRIPYINYVLSKEIVIYRSKKSDPLTIDDLKNIKAFPLDKLKIIAVYLDF